MKNKTLLPPPLDKELAVLLDKLYKRLKVLYPPHHYNHIDIWSGFWDLISEIDEK